jgi:F0F1-type ATP synthase gamma subunit
LGELNTLLVNAMLDQRKSKEDQIIVMGERGARDLEDMEEKFVLFPGVSDEIAYSQTEKIRDYLINGYRKKFGRVFVIYPQFVSVTLQRVVAYQLFPYTIPQARTSIILEELLIEPSFHRVVEGMIELWAGYKLLELFWSSKQSEFAARIMHLEGSTQELAHLKQKLSLEYFRQVHTIRDKIIREITGSKIMLDKKRRMLKPVSNN